jgi:hypothetical protein
MTQGPVVIYAFIIVIVVLFFIVAGFVALDYYWPNFFPGIFNKRWYDPYWRCPECATINRRRLFSCPSCGRQRRRKPR